MQRKKLKMLTAAMVLSMLSATVVPYGAENPESGSWKRAGANQSLWRYERDSGNYVRNNWFKDKDGTWYHFDGAGYMQTGWFYGPDGRTFYLAGDGSMATGWRKIANGPDGEKWYYFDAGGALAKG